MYGNQTKLGAKLGLCTETISRYHKGERKVPIKVRWALLMLEKEPKLSPTYSALETTVPAWQRTLAFKTPPDEADRFLELLAEGESFSEKEGAILVLALMHSLEVFKVEKTLIGLIKELTK